MEHIKIFRSMVILQKEKLIVIKKELLHLRHIADFYRDDKRNPSQRGAIAQKIYTDIDKYIEIIKELNKNINKYYNEFGSGTKRYLEFLTLYDHYNNDIKEILKIVKLIQSKFLQFQHEHFNQYMPVPNINKRYSTKGFLDYLKIYHTQILEKEDLKADSHPITLWGHLDTFVAHSGEEVKCKNCERYIEIPFWHYEIPFMLPFITHEIGHIVLDRSSDNSNSKLKTIKNKLLENKKLQNAIKAGRDSANRDILDEILADIFALLHHGEAYIIAQIHELFGKNFSIQFYSQDSEKPANITSIDAADLHLTEALARLIITIEIYSIFDENSEDKSNDISVNSINEAKKILQWILIEIPNNQDTAISGHTEALLRILDENPSGLAKIYHNYGLTKIYIDFHFKVTHLKNIIIEDIKNNESFYENIFSSFTKNGLILKNFRETYIEMIGNRLNKQNKQKLGKCLATTKNEVRKLLLTKDGVLKKDPPKGKLCKVGKPYELVYFKARTDEFEMMKDEQNYLEKLMEEIEKHHKTIFFEDRFISPYFAFDYFTAVALSEKKEETTIDEVDRFLQTSPTNTTQEVKFYTIKHSLILICNEANGENNNGKYTVFLNFALNENNSEKTNEAVGHIKTVIKNNNIKTLNTYKIFKSLGPKEIVLYIENISLKTIFDLKKSFFASSHQKESSNPFRRSYTVIAIKPSDINKAGIASDSLQFGSYIRAKINTELPSDNYMEVKSLRTGVQDYMIKWKTDTGLKSIIDYYQDLIENKKSTDIQTFVSKNEELEE